MKLYEIAEAIEKRVPKEWAESGAARGGARRGG